MFSVVFFCQQVSRKLLTSTPNLIKEEDLILVDKSYILSDFEEEESDILYKVNINGEEVIFYVLLEFQSKVDFQMPMRLLFYMTEVWRDVLKNTDIY